MLFRTSTVRTRLEQFQPAARQRYTRSGRALYRWILEGVSRLPLEDFGSDADTRALRNSVVSATRELRTNYYRARAMWQSGDASQRIEAANLMQQSAVIALRLDLDIRRHAARVPAIARWLSSGTVTALTRALREAVRAGEGPLTQAASSFGLGAGVALGLGLLAMFMFQKA